MPWRVVVQGQDEEDSFVPTTHLLLGICHVKIKPTITMNYVPCAWRTKCPEPSGIVKNQKSKSFSAVVKKGWTELHSHTKHMTDSIGSGSNCIFSEFICWHLKPRCFRICVDLGQSIFSIHPTPPWVLQMEPKALCMSTPLLRYLGRTFPKRQSSHKANRGLGGWLVLMGFLMGRGNLNTQRDTKNVHTENKWGRQVIDPFCLKYTLWRDLLSYFFSS